jgi:hypothetical protein
MPDTVGTQSAVAGANQDSISPLAGKPAPKDMLVDVARLEREYFERRPDLQDPNSLSASAPADTAGRPFKAPSPKPISSRSPRQFASTGDCEESTVRCTWAKIRTRCLVPHSGLRLRC